MAAPRLVRPRPRRRPARVFLLLFDGVEELDVVGPYEVLSQAQLLRPEAIQVRAVTVGRSTVRARFGLRWAGLPSFYRLPSPDLVLIPGGPGRRLAMHDARLLRRLRRLHDRGTRLASVCTGAFLLAEAGLLEGRVATTHTRALAELRRYRTITVRRARWIDEGSVLTSAGISAGIDLAFHLVERLGGRPLARQVARRMEYRLRPAPRRAALPGRVR